MLRMKLITIVCCAVAGLWCLAGKAAAQSPAVESREQAPIVLAQSNEGGLFRSLFGKRRKVKRGSDVRDDKRKKKKARKKSRRKKKKSTTARASTGNKPPASVEKKTDARTVLVIGDFMANGLAKGLVDALAANASIKVVNASSGSSGLVRDDYYDWNQNTPNLVAEHNASMILVMIGANDRQTIRKDGKKIDVGKEAWKPAYEERVAAFADVLAGQGVPVIWLGLAPVSKASLSRDYSVFNSMFRQKSELKRFKFVDVWNGFADEKGRYVARGPDINGQSRSLRGKSGLSFTKAGRRKLAFFVERDVVKILSDDQAALFAALPGGGAGSSGASVPAISAMMPIESISIKSGSELSIAPKPVDNPAPAELSDTSGTPGPAGTPGSPGLSGTSDEAGSPSIGQTAELASNTNSGAAARDTIPNRPLSSPAGRADDFTWPAPQ